MLCGQEEMINRPMKWLEGFRSLWVVPAALLPLLPSSPCPLCLAAYTSVFSSLGLGFLVDDQAQSPLILLFLGITLLSTAWTTQKHHKVGQLLTVLTGSLIIIAARIIWRVSPLVYVGIGLIVAGALWNLALKIKTLRFSVSHAFDTKKA